MKFLRHVQPGNALSDFRDVFRDAGPKRWPIAALSALLTLGILSVMSWESWKGPRAKPDIIYIASWPLDRTEAETQAFIAENQKRKEAREALEAEREKLRRELWSGLGRASGMDVDSIAAKADAERAAEAAKARKAAEALIEPERTRPTPPDPR